MDAEDKAMYGPAVFDALDALIQDLVWAIHAVPVVEERTQFAALDPLVDGR